MLKNKILLLQTIYHRHHPGRRLLHTNLLRHKSHIRIHMTKHHAIPGTKMVQPIFYPMLRATPLAGKAPLTTMAIIWELRFLLAEPPLCFTHNQLFPVAAVADYPAGVPHPHSDRNCRYRRSAQPPARVHRWAASHTAPDVHPATPPACYQKAERIPARHHGVSTHRRLAIINRP